MRIWGHPVHPLLVHFPIAFWTAATVAYVAAALGLHEGAMGIARLGNGVGLIIALLAMVAGLLELRRIQEGSHALRVATWHMMIMGVVWLCYLLALLLPAASNAAIEPATAQLVATSSAIFGFLLMGVGGWLGGRLVYEFGVGAKQPPKS